MKATTLSALLILGITVANATPLMSIKFQRSSVSVTSAYAGVFGAFHAHRQLSGVGLSWKVTTADAEEFIIERSYDGTLFETIDHVPPTTAAWNKYQDNTAQPGYSYYRIKAVLADGSVDYSATVVVRIVRHG